MMNANCKRTCGRAALAAVVIAVALPLWSLEPAAQGGTSFQKEYERLLLSYAAYKEYPEKTIPPIEARISPDRLNTLKAVVRAGLSDLQPGGPLLALVDAVQGVWGVRPGNSEGRHQFRVSVRLRPDARTVLDRSSFFKSAGGAHVLEPVKKGGDDDPTFTGFKVNTSARTWRQVADDPPRLQISQLISDETIGEIDLDFHEFLCHFNPSNSDPGGLKDVNHSHLGMTNRTFAFPPDLAFACQNVASHCDGSYKLPYCQ
jgi:hypothetical protein